jgi:hypothetical protein
MRELKISKNSFDAAWIAAIEDTGRHDWYEPFRRKPIGRHQPLPCPRAGHSGDTLVLI